MRMKIKFTLIAAFIAAIAAPVFTATDSYARSKGAKIIKAPAYAYTQRSKAKASVIVPPGAYARDAHNQELLFDRAAAPLNQQ